MSLPSRERELKLEVTERIHEAVVRSLPSRERELKRREAQPAVYGEDVAPLAGA